jgi:hypothetical protein
LTGTAGGIVGSVLTLWATFAPCFVFVFFGAPIVERLRSHTALTGALAAVTASVVPRADSITDHGMVVPPAMGTAIAINFQPMGGGRAAITGDFVMLADEVNPVLAALRQNGIEVTAVHNHMLDDEPRTFYAHFWAVDDAVKLATGLRAALDKLKLAKS